MTTDKFKALVDEGNFPGAFLNKDNIWIIPKSALEHFINNHLEDFNAQKQALKTGVYIKDNKEYITLSSFAKACSLGKETISYHISNNRITDYLMIGKSYFINKELVNDVLKISIKAVSNFTLDNYEERMLNLYKNDSIVKNKEKTFNIFIKFSILKVKESRTKNISATLNFYKSALLRLLNLIDKELYLCSDEEIKILLSDKSLTEQNKKHIITFINYHKNVVKNCKYDNTYTFTTKYVEKTDKKIYTKEEFLKMYNYVRDIDIHLEKALKDPLYAEIWFYISLHFTNAWRAEDVLDFPLSNISDLLSMPKPLTVWITVPILQIFL